MRELFTILALGFLVWKPTYAESKLYSTGPTEDAAFVRIVNTLDGPLEVQTSENGHLELAAESSTIWQAVRARTPFSASLSHGGKSERVKILVQPSEFVTVAVIAENSASWKAELVRESPIDFSAFKVSLALVNLDMACPLATIKLAGKEVAIIDEVAPRAIKRRQINPITLAVDLYCQSKRIGTPIDLGALRAGERWTLLVRPTSKGAPILPILDRMP